MGPTRRVLVAIEIEQVEGTIRGRFAVDGTPGSRFFGWLELIDLLDRASGHRGTGYGAEPVAQADQAC